MRSFIVVLITSIMLLLSFIWIPGIGAQTTALSHEAPSTPTAVGPVQQNVSVPTTGGSPGLGSLIIGSGDLLVVSVYGASDFNKEVRVADSGEISLPLVGSVHVAGLNVQQAEILVQQRLSEEVERIGRVVIQFRGAIQPGEREIVLVLS